MDMPAHQLTMTVLMTPDTANFAGKVHGGTILKLLDQVAYACASRYAGRYVVTLSVDQVMFRQPIHVGELVSFLASVNHTGTTSMEVGIKVIAEDIRTQDSRHVNSCFFTMIAMGDDGRPAEVPALRPFTPDERRRFAAAQARKAQRHSAHEPRRRRSLPDEMHLHTGHADRIVGGHRVPRDALPCSAVVHGAAVTLAGTGPRLIPK